MAYHFKLLNKSDGSPVDLDELDKILCNLVGEEISEKYYCLAWFDIIGFEIARGKYLGSEDLRNSIIKWYNPHKRCDFAERDLMPLKQHRRKSWVKRK